MSDWVRNNGMKALDLWKESSLSQRILIGGVFGSVLGIIILMTFWLRQEEYSLLYSNLYAEDAASVVEILQKEKVPYQLKDNGAAVLVPRDSVYDLRLKIASAGVLHGQGIGFEIFNENKLGQTEFVQHINYQRALQGELSRTINEIPEVASARIHLVLPDKSLFIEEQKPPSAAVMLKLKAGRTLNTQQVQSIVNLVATAVEGLERKNITVTDSRGRLLYEPDRENGLAGLTSTQLEYQLGVQKDLETRIEQLLVPVIGPGKVIAKVNADLDFNRRTVRKETYDPKSSVVRSENVSEENSRGQANLAKDIPEIAYEGEVEGLGSGSSQEVSRTSAMTNYEINKEEQEIVTALGDIKRLSIAVIVDGEHQKGQDGTYAFTPLGDKQLANVRQLVSRAVGLDAARGDSIEVSCISFGPPEAIPAETMADKLAHWYEMGKPFINSLLIVLVLIFVVRPILMSFLPSRVEEGDDAALEGLPGEGQEALGSAEDGLGEMEAQKRIEDMKVLAHRLTSQYFEQSLLVIKTWMKEGEA